MFQDAVAASYLPARSPTRGSGIGSPTDMLLLAAEGATPDVEIAGAQAAAEKSPRATDSDVSLAVNRARERYSADMIVSSVGRKRERNCDARNYGYSTVMPRVRPASIF